MGIREDMERAYADWDEGLTDNGPFGCVYTQEYTDSLDIQGVARTVSMPRHIADEREIVVGTVINSIQMRDGRHVPGPLTVETVELQGRATVNLRLRAG
jgi:hypothetical protein